MIRTLPSHTVCQSIDRPLQEVYDFVSRPENLCRWASGLGQSVRRVNGDWVADTPAGSVRITFCPPNAFGVLDHTVTMASGAAISVPMRVVANGSGSLLMLTVFQLPDMAGDTLAADIKWVENDFTTLKTLLEAGGAAT